MLLLRPGIIFSDAHQYSGAHVAHPSGPLILFFITPTHPVSDGTRSRSQRSPRNALSSLPYIGENAFNVWYAIPPDFSSLRNPAGKKSLLCVPCALERSGREMTYTHLSLTALSVPL